jgi:tetratricopeptide (TPR) repeat protein
MGDYEGALEDAETTIALIQELNPSDDEWAVVLDTRAYALLLLGDYEDALADYDQALSATVNTHATYTLGRGLALLALGDQPRALDAFKWGSLITLGSRLDPELEDLLARMHAALAEVMPAEQPDTFEPDDTPERAAPLIPGGATQMRSLHTAGDLDWASIDLVMGQRVHIEARSPTCDTYLTLYRADGRTVVWGDDDGGVYRDSVIDTRAPATETYRIQVRHFFPEGTCAAYELAATVAGR